MEQAHLHAADTALSGGRGEPAETRRRSSSGILDWTDGGVRTSERSQQRHESRICAPARRMRATLNCYYLLRPFDIVSSRGQSRERASRGCF